MSKKKRSDLSQPAVLTDLTELFSPASGIPYDKFEKLANNTSEIVPEKFRESIYVSTTAMCNFINDRSNESINSFIQLNLFYRWSKSKEIYQFDKDFAEELMKTEITTIPHQALEHLPYKTFAITIDDNYVLVHHCYDKNHIESDYLFLAYVDKQASYVHCLGIPMSAEFSTVESLAALCENKSQIDDVIGFLNLVIYLAAEKPDIESNPEQKTITKRSPHKTRNVYREIRKWNVGYRFGAAFRKQKSEKSANNDSKTDASSHTGSPKRPHIRRGHWHSYWTGHKSEPESRKLIVKWLCPIAVNINYDTQNQPAVIHNTERNK